MTTEKDFQAAVVEYAKLCGWRVYHTYDSRRSEPGFPDLCMVRAPRLVFLELKRDLKAKVTPDQAAWLTELQAVGAENPHVEAYMVTPDCWPWIEEALR